MKLLIFVAAVFALLWLLKRSLGGRSAPPPSRSAKPDATGKPQQIIACAQCGMHLPRDEALPGRGGVFCGDAHRAAYEKAHPE
ncbi:hypothetical protein BH11PSE9_BH11PSE9_13640 [soil metagenome]